MSLLSGARVADRFYPVLDKQGKIAELPSVSTIISVAGQEWLEAWRKRIGYEKAEQISKETRDIGTDVHSLIERVNTGGSISQEEWNSQREGVLNGMRGFSRWQDATGFKPYRSEIIVVSLEYGYAGMLDATGRCPDLLELFDWKISSRLNPNVRLQIAAYWMAYLETYPEEELHGARAVRFDRKTGNYEQMIVPAEDIPADFAGFLELKRQWGEQNG